MHDTPEASFTASYSQCTAGDTSDCTGVFELAATSSNDTARLTEDDEETVRGAVRDMLRAYGASHVTTKVVGGLNRTAVSYTVRSACLFISHTHTYTHTYIHTNTCIHTDIHTN